MSAKSVAVKLLSRREHSVFEIREKLLKRDFAGNEVDQAIGELKEGGWLSDERYAEAYIRIRQQKGFGPVRIAIELKERGVSPGIVDSSLSADDEIWMQALTRQYVKKYKNKPAKDYNDKAKRIRFLQYRGFALDMIYQLIDENY